MFYDRHLFDLDSRVIFSDMNGQEVHRSYLRNNTNRNKNTQIHAEITNLCLTEITLLELSMFLNIY